MNWFVAYINKLSQEYCVNHFRSLKRCDIIMYTKLCFDFTDNQIKKYIITNRNVLLIKLNHILSIFLIKVRENIAKKNKHKTHRWRGGVWPQRFL